MKGSTFRITAKESVAIATVLTVFALSGTAASAALPPYWQRTRELQAILESGEIARKLNNRPIDTIERIGIDLYRVRADGCSLEIEIVTDPSGKPPGWVGPRPFHLKIGEPVCQ